MGGGLRVAALDRMRPIERGLIGWGNKEGDDAPSKYRKSWKGERVLYEAR
jgi:hypothetical protein